MNGLREVRQFVTDRGQPKPMKPHPWGPITDRHPQWYKPPRRIDWLAVFVVGGYVAITAISVAVLVGVFVSGR